MRMINYTNKFKQDFKRNKKSGHHKTLDQDFLLIVRHLASDQPLAEKHRDHALTNNWKDHRDCHVKPDLVLIYRKVDFDILELVRLGSHSELGI